jgi:uncharacterized repeat protein (TIGR03987 family)
MSLFILVAVIAVTIALILYSWTTWIELRSARVSRRSLAAVSAALTFDIIGTVLMTVNTPGFNLDVHTYIGFTALAVMIIKTGWFAVRYVRGATTLTRRNRIFVTAAWVLWVFVYFSGMAR